MSCVRTRASGPIRRGRAIGARLGRLAGHEHATADQRKRDCSSSRAFTPSHGLTPRRLSCAAAMVNQRDQQLHSETWRCTALAASLGSKNVASRVRGPRDGAVQYCHAFTCLADPFGRRSTTGVTVGRRSLHVADLRPFDVLGRRRRSPRGRLRACGWGVGVWASRRGCCSRGGAS